MCVCVSGLLDDLYVRVFRRLLIFFSVQTYTRYNTCLVFLRNCYPSLVCQLLLLLVRLLLLLLLLLLLKGCCTSSVVAVNAATIVDACMHVLAAPVVVVACCVCAIDTTRLSVNSVLELYSSLHGHMIHIYIM